jgi:hypothetical protein
MSTFPACSRSAKPSKEAVDFIASSLAGDRVRLIALETKNPHGGRGGSLDSDQCAWLVRELAKDRQRGVVITTRHRSSELRNDRVQSGSTPRILADELVSLLLAHPNVLGGEPAPSRRDLAWRTRTGPMGDDAVADGLRRRGVAGTSATTGGALRLLCRRPIWRRSDDTCMNCQ